MYSPSAPHLGLVSARVINEDAAHHLGRKGIEMLPVFVCDLPLIQELQIELVHQGRGLQQVGVPLPPNVRGGDLSEMGVDKRHQLFKDRGLTISPFLQQQSDLARVDAQSISNRVGGL
jgi:hypothetical protein